jgi:hypothetical protein
VALSRFAAAASGMALRVRVARPEPARLVLDYALQGDIAGVRVSPSTGADPTQPTEGLWRHTCMEVFVRPALPGAYLEFNFAPHGQWAAYRFSGYRSGMTALTGIGPPRIGLEIGADCLRLSADIALPGELAGATLRLAVTAVVEDAAGQLDYWALRHPGPQPDFHHPDGFELEI